MTNISQKNTTPMFPKTIGGFMRCSFVSFGIAILHHPITKMIPKPAPVAYQPPHQDDAILQNGGIRRMMK